jgi:hypothetical protein
MIMKQLFIAVMSYELLIGFNRIGVLLKDDRKALH